MTSVGLIGMGHMGHGIARNLLIRGHGLVYLDHPGNRPADEVLSLGGRPLATPSAIASAAEVVILCVTGSPQVEAVMQGPDGLLTGLGPGMIVVDCSTALPDETCRIGALVQGTGARMLDAPMTRTAQAAHEGRLHLLVGGEASDLEAVRPVLSAFAEAIAHVGPLGSGHRLKLLHNFVSVGFITLLAEAAAQGADAGLDPDVLIRVLRAGGGGGTALDRMEPFLTRGDREAMPFSVANAAKDLDYHCRMSAASGAGHAIASGIAGVLASALREGHGEANLPEMARLLRRDAPRP